MRLRAALVAALVVAAPSDPHRFALTSTGRVKGASGVVRLVPASSPFGVAVTADGHTTYDLTLTVAGLPDPPSLGAFTAYIAWIATPDLGSVERLGAIAQGRPVAGRTSWNKFVIVVTAEASTRAEKRRGPSLLVGRSPSATMQSFADHPFYNTGAPPF
ncbi:MAG: hypothetical protein ABJD07_09630 [Gemmatimonadaceae bacterium]